MLFIRHCPTSQTYEEQIKKLAVDFSDKGVAIVAISPNDRKAVRLDEPGYPDLSHCLSTGTVWLQNLDKKSP